MAISLPAPVFTLFAISVPGNHAFCLIRSYPRDAKGMPALARPGWRVTGAGDRRRPVSGRKIFPGKGKKLPAGRAFFPFPIAPHGVLCRLCRGRYINS